jgi:hypothetical protein
VGLGSAQQSPGSSSHRRQIAAGRALGNASENGSTERTLICAAAIVIRVSGVRVPPPASLKALQTERNARYQGKRMGPTISLAISLEGRVGGADCAGVAHAASRAEERGGDRAQRGCASSLADLCPRGSVSEYARTTNNGTACGRFCGGSPSSPGAGRFVSQRQDELGVRGREGWSPTMPPRRPAHPLYATHARWLARRTAAAVERATPSCGARQPTQPAGS